MKTQMYNPSILEVQLAEGLSKLSAEIEKQLDGNQIINIENKIHEDNPLVKLFLLDRDGDPHEVVLKIIQTPDKF